MLIADSEKEYPERSVILLILLYVFSFLVILEWKSPFFFLQDDNRSSTLPLLVHNFRGVMNGEISQFNFHQFLGIQHLSCGQNMVLYPLSYLSIVMSKVFFGHFYFSVDILVIMHLLIGSIGLYKFSRLIGIDQKSSFLGGIIWPLCPFTIWGSTSWHFIAGAACYIPWAFFFARRLLDRNNFSDFLWLVFFRSLHFYVGYVQLFVLGCIFEFIFISLSFFFVFSEKKSGECLDFIKLYFFSFVFNFLLVAPLFFPMWHQASISVGRSKPLSYWEFSVAGYPPYYFLLGLVFPFADLFPALSLATDTWGFNNCLPYLSHIGYVFLIFAVFEIFRNIRHRFFEDRLSAIFIGLFVFSLLWATNIITPLIYYVPILNRFRWPFKVGWFSILFLFMIGLKGISHFLSNEKLNEKSKTKFLLVLLIFNTLNFFFLFANTPKRSFKTHHDDIPFDEPLKDKLVNGRILTVGYTDTEDYTLPTLGFSYATFWGLFQFGGYEVLISEPQYRTCLGLYFSASYRLPNLPIGLFREWGVRWYVVKTQNDPARKNVEKLGLKRIHEDGNRVVYEDPETKPIVTLESNGSSKEIPFQISPNDLSIKFSENNPGKVTIRIFYDSMFQVFLNESPIEPEINRNNQITLKSQSGENRILIRYQNTLFSSGCTLFAGGIAILVFVYLRRKFVSFPSVFSKTL